MPSLSRRLCATAMIAALLLGAAFSVAADERAPAPTRLRTEYTANPLGVDEPHPRFGWWMQHTERDQVQTAYQVVVASSAELLAADQGDLWDSGRVESDDSVHVVYAGAPLASTRRYHWKVRTWDRQGRPSAWSEPAWFEMALLDPAASPAQWIAADKPAHDTNGFHTEQRSAADDAQWIQVDLGGPTEIAAVVLYPARPYDWIRDEPGFGFPVHYRVEASQRRDGRDAVVVFDGASTPQPNPGVEPVRFDLPEPLTTGYVRVIATELYDNGRGEFQFCLAELEVLTPDGKNIAPGKRIRSSSSLEQGGWSRANLVDNVRVSQRGSQGAPMLRREFTLSGEVARARAYASGVGYYVLWLNGQRVGDHIIDPAYTVHEERTLYSVYDITPYLRDGVNAAGMMLGEGWWRGQRGAWLHLHIEYADGRTETVVTDNQWKWTPGPVVEDSLYHGETYDARRELPGWNEPGCDVASWSPTVPLSAAPKRLACQIMPPIRVTEEITPKTITRLGDQYIVDFGQNLTGRLRLDVSGPAGTEVVMRHAEVLHPDGALNTLNLRSARATDRYILKGDGRERYAPEFTQHGFRYAEITGYPGELTPDALTAEVFHTDFERAGWFDSTSPHLNAVRDITIWAIRGNNMSIPTDCPQRDERMGWMGDAHLAAEPTIVTYDAASYYRNWLRVIADSQGEEGHVPDTAPRAHFGQLDGSPPWAVAYPLVAWYCYRYYGDLGIVAEHYDNLVAYFGTLEAHAEDHIISFCRYGDWVGVEETPGDIISTGCYYWTAQVLEEFAGALGKTDDAAHFAQRRRDIADAFEARLFDNANGFYGNGSQFSQIWPIYLGIARDDQLAAGLARLRSEIMDHRGGHLATGILGAKYVFDVLTDHGMSDVAYTVAFQQDYPSWGYMLNHGATTLWELWEEKTVAEMNSHNHQMFGAILSWMACDIGGVRALPEPGYRSVVIAPVIEDVLGGASTTLNTVRGPIACTWRTDERHLFMEVSIPPNCRAQVIVPEYGGEDAKIYLDDVEVAGGSRAFDLGSGRYRFAVR